MGIKDILKQLPKGYKEACWETKAMSRKRGVQDEESLILLCLYYAYDKSLIDTQNYAKKFLSIKISDVGFMKRFSCCNNWIKWINQQMLNERISAESIPEKLKGKKVKVIDASDIVSKGAIKQTWRLHYAFDLYSMSCAEYKITQESTGESLKNFTIEKDDLIIADRVYATITGIECCYEAEADFIMRIRNKAFKIYDAQGCEIKLTELFKNVGNSCCDFTVYYKDSHKKFKPIRLCAVQKNEQEQNYQQDKLRRIESKKQMKISEETKFTHNYFFVITSLDESFSSEEIIAMYRLRWQVEMVFKRLKSIMNLGSMPTKTAATSETWLNCKMLIALLIEKLLSSVDFSPCGHCKECVEGNKNFIPFDFSLLF